MKRFFILKFRQFTPIILILPFIVYYDYQMIYLATKPAKGIILLANLWLNASSIFCINLFFRFGASSNNKKNLIFSCYAILQMIGILFYSLSIPNIIFNPAGCIMLIFIAYVISEMIIDNTLIIIKTIQSKFL